MKDLTDPLAVHASPADSVSESVLFDRRTVLTLAVSGAVSGLLSACLPGPDDDDKQKPNQKKPCPLTTAQLKDKMMGMLLLGAYGDALGAPHEVSGLSGNTGDPATAQRLRPFRDYNRAEASPWGIWPNPANINRDKKGVPTDDTSFRVSLLHQWLCEEARGNSAPTEARFLAWLRRQRQPAATAPQWQKSRHQQSLAWICMLEDCQRMRTNPDGFQERDCNPFFRQNIPVVFGLFMYLELAAIYACCPRDQVFNRFKNFTCLDQSYGQYITALLATVLSQGLCESDKQLGFDQWFAGAVDGVVNANLGDAAQRRVVKAAVTQARQFGRNNRNLNEKDFIEKLKREIFDAALPAPADRRGLRSFDPLLFLKQMTAVAAYAGNDVRKALRLLAVGPGDADTVPSQLGSIIGACLGERRLRQLNPGFSQDLTAAKDCIKRLYNIELSDLADCLVTLAHKQGCCQRR